MKRNQEEHKIQCAIIEWARLNWQIIPELQTLHAIPNGGARDAATGAMLKREGVLKGVWDLFLPYPMKLKRTDGVHCVLIQVVVYCGLYIEVKTPKGRLTQEQKWFGEQVRANGYATFVARSTSSGINAILAYLNGEFVHGTEY